MIITIITIISIITIILITIYPFKGAIEEVDIIDLVYIYPPARCPSTSSA